MDLDLEVCHPLGYPANKRRDASERWLHSVQLKEPSCEISVAARRQALVTSISSKQMPSLSQHVYSAIFAVCH